MIESSSFRQINETEGKIIVKSISKISFNISQFLERSKKILYISIIVSNLKPKYPIIYLISDDIMKNLNFIEVENKIYSAGLYFGFIKKGNFYLSLEGAEYLYKQGNLSDLKRINLNIDGEKSVLYGNNILKNMVAETPSNLQVGDFLLIFNKSNEILAIAQSKVDSKGMELLKPRDLIATNLYDKGIYIRKEQ